MSRRFVNGMDWLKSLLDEVCYYNYIHEMHAFHDEEVDKLEVYPDSCKGDVLETVQSGTNMEVGILDESLNCRMAHHCYQLTLLVQFCSCGRSHLDDRLH
jgi:hypothetical protein